MTQMKQMRRLMVMNQETNPFETTDVVPVGRAGALEAHE
jgi:hypothetical protein